MLDNNFFCCNIFSEIFGFINYFLSTFCKMLQYFLKKMMDNNFVSTFSMAPRRRKARRPVARRVGRAGGGCGGPRQRQGGLARAPGGSPWRARWPGDGGMQQLAYGWAFIPRRTADAIDSLSMRDDLLCTSAMANQVLELQRYNVWCTLLTNSLFVCLPTSGKHLKVLSQAIYQQGPNSNWHLSVERDNLPLKASVVCHGGTRFRLQ
jgi:hypothetical protein